MDFVDVFEFFCGMGRKNTRKTWGKPCTNHHMHVSFTSVLIERQKRTNIGEVIGGAHHMNALSNKLFGNMSLGSGRAGQHDDIDIKRIIKRTAINGRSFTETVRDHFDSIATFVAEHNLVVISGNKLAGKTRADRANPKNSDTRHVSRDPGRTVRASLRIEAGQHLIRGAERRRRQAPPCRWQPWPVGSSSSWG